MSPIFVRPVREQLEHDRLIRHLVTAKYKRKSEIAATNIGDEQLVPVKIAASTYFPDLVLTEGKKLSGLVEVETGESVNNLEAMYQWVPFSRARVPFHLYVPVQGYDAARRLIEANQAKVTEIWTYRPVNDGFDLVRMFVDSSAPRASKGAAAPMTTSTRSAKTGGEVAPSKAATPAGNGTAATAKPVKAAPAKAAPAKAAPAKAAPARAKAAAKAAKPEPRAKSAKPAAPKKSVKSGNGNGKQPKNGNGKNGSGKNGHAKNGKNAGPKKAAAKPAARAAQHAAQGKKGAAARRGR